MLCEFIFGLSYVKKTLKLLNNIIWINHLAAFSTEIRFISCNCVPDMILHFWYLCHKTPLKTELKSPGIEFSLSFHIAWLAENSYNLILVIPQLASPVKIFLWTLISTTEEKGCHLFLCVCGGLIVWIVLFLAPKIFLFYIYLNQ